MDWVQLLREFGFPIFVCVWFMTRLEKRVDRMIELSQSHMQATALLAKTVDQIEESARYAPVSEE